MKRRYVYVMLFVVPALLAALILSLLLFGAAAGVLWIFVYGDNPWPSAAGNALTAMLGLACVTLWVTFLSVAYIAGKRQEARATLNTRHVMVSLGATALLLALAVSHQWRVGNIGAQSDDVLCAEFCQGRGFSGSGMPPRDAGAATCSCFDAQGREAVKVPMGNVTRLRTGFPDALPAPTTQGVHHADGSDWPVTRTARPGLERGRPPQGRELLGDARIGAFR